MNSLYRFSTATMPPAVRMAAWKEHVEQVMYPATYEAFTSEGLLSHYASVDIEGGRTHATTSSSHSLNRLTGSEASGQLKGQVFCVIPISGGFSYHTSSGMYLAQPGAALVYDPRAAFFSVFQDGTKLIIFELGEVATTKDSIAASSHEPLTVPLEQLGQDSFQNADALHERMSWGRDAKKIEELAGRLRDGLTSALNPSISQDYLRSARKFIEEHGHFPELQLSDVADHVGLSSRHLARILAQAGTSFTDAVREHRIKLAMQLLVYSNKSLTRIAAECGFGMSSSFARAFRRYTGVSPSQYRRERTGLAQQAA